jgi:imidazolonepropionase-like amidohydrolase
MQRESSIGTGLALISSAACEIKIHNLQLLHRHGVTIAIGSDHADTSLAEALHLHALNVFDNLTLLKMWCETTPRAIFPQRKIGSFKEGYEARFLVLDENPIDRFEAVTRINMRFKEGHPLQTDR